MVSRLIICRKYIKYFLLLIVISVFYSNLSADNHDFPFSDHIGYVTGGKPFHGTIKNEDGKIFSLHDFKGKVVIIVFFTTWCPNCHNVLQDLEFLIKKFKNLKNIKIVALNIGNDSLEEIRAHYKSYDLQLLEVYYSVPSAMMCEVRGVPTCLVFNKEGIPIWGYMGAANFSSVEFTDFIENLAK